MAGRIWRRRAGISSPRSMQWMEPSPERCDRGNCPRYRQSGDDGQELGAKGRFVAVEAADHRVQEGGFVQGGDVHGVAGVGRQGGREGHLGSAVTFTERVNLVQPGEEGGRLVCKGFAAEATEVMVGAQLDKELTHLRGDVFGIAEDGGALADADRSIASRPAIDIAEQIAVDGFVVTDAEAACG